MCSMGLWIRIDLECALGPPEERQATLGAQLEPPRSSLSSSLLSVGFDRTHGSANFRLASDGGTRDISRATKPD